MEIKIMKNHEGKMMFCCNRFEMELATKRGYTIEGSFLEYFQKKSEELRAAVNNCAEDEDGYYYGEGCYEAMEVMHKAVPEFEFRDYNAFYRLVTGWEGYDDARGMQGLMKQCKAEVEAMTKKMEALQSMFETFEDLFKDIALNDEDLASELEEN